MIKETVILLLVFNIISTSARVAETDIAILNIIKDAGKIKTTNETEIHIDLPTIKPEIDSNASTTEITTESHLITCGNLSKHITDNTIDSDEEQTITCREKEEEDVGTALILTDLLKEGRTDEARTLARVTNPEMFLGVESYSGFFTVNETQGSNMFFWYFPVEKKPVNETPWVIWLQGGPGASSMTGLFDELGPFRIGPEGELERNPYSWLQNHSLVFIDNPVGTGFSYTNDEDGFATDMDTYGDHLYSAFSQLVRVFPELGVAPLYIAGESYAGKYIPALAIRIHRHRDTDKAANLQGLIAGNAYIDPAMISQLQRPFYYFGLLESEQLRLLQPLLSAFQDDIAHQRSVEAKHKWNSLITVLLLLTNQKHAYNFLRDDLAVGRYISFLQKPQVKHAIHVGDIKFSFVNMTVNTKLNGDFISSAKSLYEELLEHYRVLTYCGQLDQMLSCVLTSENYRTWQWNGSKEFLEATRLPYYYDRRLAGYHKSGGRLTEVVVRGAGHMAALDAPAAAQHLVARWTHRRALGAQPLLQSNFVRDFVTNHSSTFYYF